MKKILKKDRKKVVYKTMAEMPQDVLHRYLQDTYEKRNGPADNRFRRSESVNDKQAF